MAILYGTTGTGETLPVEVNEFGQLIAEGLPGPPGPPGLPELPPDPFEGAVLGWKDNTLSWLGGSVPLPVGTYGPITAYQGGVLTLASEVDLPYLAQFFLSTKLGSELFWNPSTSLISNVTGEALTLTDDTNLANFRVGDVVQAVGTGNPEWNETQVWSNKTTLSGNWIRPEFKANIFGGAPNTGGDGILLPYISSGTGTLEFVGLPAGTTWEVNFGFGGEVPAGTGYKINDGPLIGVGDLNNKTFTTLTAAQLNNQDAITKIELIRTSGGSGGIDAPSGIKVDGKLLVDASTVFSITSVSTSPARINVDGGKWLGTDGTGDPDGERTVVGPEIMGQGSVQSAAGNTIVLREDNGGWKVGEYITTTDMAIAARFVAAQARKAQITPNLYKEQ